jgi:DNA modification methylase
MVMLQLYCGNVIDELNKFPADLVHCVVTSPPYWGLRDYGLEPQIWDGLPDCDHDWTPGGGGLLHENRNFKRGTQEEVSGSGPLVKVREESRGGDSFCSKCGAWRGQLGLEPDYRLYVSHIVQIFEAIRRVLRPDGVCFLNLGDSYAGSWGNYSPGSPAPQDGWSHSRFVRRAYDDRNWRPVQSHKQTGLKPKDLCGIPWRVALALQDAGWWLRSDIIWNKPNPMPESILDRPTRSHEYIFLLAKSRRYYWDADAVRQPCVGDHHDGKRKEYNTKPTMAAGKRKGVQVGNNPAGRNLRTVWTMTTQSTPEAHFATFPEKLVRRCIKAGTSEHGVCASCGAPWKRDRSKNDTPDTWYNQQQSILLGEQEEQKAARDPGQMVGKWKPTCKCGHSVIPALVLDPFVGSGTTCKAANNLGRRAIGIDLNPEYVAIAKKRTRSLFSLAEY